MGCGKYCTFGSYFVFRMYYPVCVFNVMYTNTIRSPYTCHVNRLGDLLVV